MLCLPVPIYTPLPWPGENFPQPDIGAVCPFSGNGAEMQRNTGYFPTESLEPSGNRLFSRSALNEGDLFRGSLNSVYTRSSQNSTPNSNATNLHCSQKRCCSFGISSSNASPTFQVQKSIFHQMTKPIQVTVILPLLLAISFSRNDDIHSSISGISNDLIGVIPTIGQ